MVRDLHFLITALLILILLWYHFIKQKQIRETNSRIFRYFLSIAIMDVFLDIVCTILMSDQYPELVTPTRLLFTLFYLMQVGLPCAVLEYGLSLRNDTGKGLRRDMLIALIPAIFMEGLVLLNIVTGHLFSFDSTGIYRTGPLYLLTYYHALGYGVATMVMGIWKRHYYDKGKLTSIFEFLIIEVTCVIVQAMTGILTTGLGIALGIMVLYLTINNPNSYIDNLTGMFDKKYFNQWMKTQMQRKTTLHMIAIELKQLKRTNNFFGTNMGDELLIQVADKLMELSESGNVFRINGNQFLIVSDTLAEYEKQRNILKDYFARDFYIKGEQIRFPAILCGIMNVSEVKDVSMLEAYMDYLIGLAVQGDDVILIQGDMHTMEGFLYQKEVEQYLDKAVKEDLFTLNYQPIYSMERGRFVSLEALSRLRHPVLGLVSPDIFIGIAERSGIINQISILQFRRLCRFVKEHPDIMENIHNVKFNLSPAELLKSGHGVQFIEIIREYDLDPTLFHFEITETVATEYSDYLYQVVCEFEKVGIGLSMDDFGSGYANLNTILKLPFSSIKLDRSLLFGICEDAQIATFYKSIVSVLNNLGYRIIAEGVETADEVQLLKEWGVDLIQGYYYAGALSEEKIVELLRG